MNNTPNNSNPSDVTYNLDFMADEVPAQQQNRRPASAASQVQVQQGRQMQQGQQVRPPLTDEERRRIAAAREAGMRRSGGAGAVPNAGNRAPRPNPNNPNVRPQNPNVRPNPNAVPRRPNPQQRPPDSLTGRRRKRKIRVNAGAVLFVLLVGAVIGVSAFQIAKNAGAPEKETQGYEDIVQNAQNAVLPGGTDTLEDGTGENAETPAGDPAASAEPNLMLYDTVTVQNDTLNEGELVLVNYQYEFTKIDDVTLTNVYNERTGKIKVSSTTLGMAPEAFDALEAMVAGLVADTGCDDLLIYSGHRTLADQQRIWDSNMQSYGEEYTKTYVAVPGHSEHHTGLACDLGFYTDDGASVPLADHEYGPWVWEHCTEYGYIMRYPAEKSDITGIGHEQWHFRYVGLAHAYAIDTLDLCLEEYIDALKQYTADTKLLHISPDRVLTDVDVTELSQVSGGWLTYFVPASEGETTEIRIPRGDKFQNYELSGNNVDGFIVTITLN
ncbi:MAG: D-alanyl-D-alanine carboxypeptidase family protein [Eubacteriales bacterium]